MFTIETYIKRRETLKSSIKSGLLLFLGNDESPMNYADNTYHFRQDSTFLYYFGFERNAGMFAFIDIDNNREVIVGDELSIDYIVWMGLLPTIKDQADRVGVRETMTTADFFSFIEKEKAKGRTIHYLPSYRPEHQIKLQQLLGIPPVEQSKHQSLELVRTVVEQRLRKSDAEIAEIDKAVTITNEMHIAAMDVARVGMKEYEVAAAVQSTALKYGCQLSFPIICTTHGETLHNHFHGNTIRKGDMLLIDAGAELPNGYCGDLTTTFPISGQFDSRQKAVFDIVMQAHNEAVAMLKPNVPFRVIYYRAAEVIVEGMKSLGLMKGNASDAVQQGAHAMFFQCGLGHAMGLDVHDMENLGEVWVGYDGEPKSTQFGIKSLRFARPLEERFVMTVEPGVYLIPTLIDMWKAEKRYADFINYDKLENWKDFGGIRFEEDFLITSTGYRLLGENNEARKNRMKNY